MTKRAFTLTELLVVIAIIALLVMILVPTLSLANKIAKRSVCQSNLNKLSTVLSHARRPNLAKPQNVTEVTMYFPDWQIWPMQAYSVAQSTEVFRCPEDDLPPSVDIGALRKRVVFRSTYGGGVEIPLAGPVVNEYCLSRRGSNNKGTYTEWVFEEAGRITTWGWDFWEPANHNDGWVRIYDATGDIEIVSCNCGGDNQLWIDNKPAFGSDPTNHAHTQIRPNVGKTLNVGCGVSGISSYGVNTFAHRYMYSSPALVLMDYESDDPLTLCADPDEPAKVRQQLLKSLRHLNQLNILLTDGSVRKAGLAEVDPVQNRALWNPSKVVPHPDD